MEGQPQEPAPQNPPPGAPPPPPPPDQVPNRVPPPPQRQTQSSHTYSQSGSLTYDQTSQTWVDQYGNVVSEEQATYVDANAGRRSLLRRLAAVISFLAGLLSVLLTARFLLLLFAANPTNDLVNFVYDVTSPFVEPFEGIFDDYVFSGDNVIEWSSLIALIIWSLVAGAIVKIMYLLFSPSDSGKQVYSTTRRNTP
jgi:uncharacterized protein YggT (Ycf19 family)